MSKSGHVVRPAIANSGNTHAAPYFPAWSRSVAACPDGARVRPYRLCPNRTDSAWNIIVVLGLRQVGGMSLSRWPADAEGRSRDLPSSHQDDGMARLKRPSALCPDPESLRRFAAKSFEESLLRFVKTIDAPPGIAMSQLLDNGPQNPISAPRRTPKSPPPRLCVTCALLSFAASG
jgi:hypothetical protein